MPDAHTQFARSTSFLRYIPQSPLASFVDSLWLYENHQPSHTKERRLPDGSMELVINLHEDAIRLYDQQHPDRFRSARGSVISGPQTEYVVLDTACQSSMMGIHFKPGGAFPFLNVPASELRDETVSLAVFKRHCNLSEVAGISNGQKSLSRVGILTRHISSTISRPFPASIRVPISDSRANSATMFHYLDHR